MPAIPTKVRVIKLPSETELGRHFPKNLLRGLTDFDVFSFPSVGTICSVTRNTVKFQGHGVCDIGTKMYHTCFEPID